MNFTSGAPDPARIAAALDRSPERSFRALTILGFIVPALLFLGAAWYDYHQVSADARRRVIATADAMAEHAQKVLETNQLVLNALAERIGGMSWDEIGHSEALHSYLVRLTAQMPQLESTFVVDPEGRIAASSRAFPMPPYDVATRDYFLAAKRGEAGLFISTPFVGQRAGTVAFTVSQATDGRGIAAGIVAVTLSPIYFEHFYAGLVEAPAESLASLIRADGTFLVRQPPRPDSDPKLSRESFLTPGGAPVRAGVFVGRSRYNGRTRLGAVHEVAGFPLFASYSIQAHAYLAVWYEHIAVLAGFALILSVVLSSSAHAAIRHARRERGNLRALLAETTRREEAEEALRQLQKIEALGRLTGGVAHDFNNLLTAIMGSLELALKRVEEQRTVRLLNGAMEAARRGARLTQQMLAFARQQHVQPRPISVNDTLRDMADLLHRSLTPRIEVRYALDPAVWPALADATQLEVAVLNLAINGRDAMLGAGGVAEMAAGGHMLELRTGNIDAGDPRPPEVPRGEFVLVSVTDTGSGMTDVVLRRAIEPFFTTKGVGQGTGLGLSMVHGFAVQAGGGLSIDTAPGRGTTVRIYLPRAAASPAPDGPAPPLPDPAAPLDVTLVDDDAQVRALTAAMLRELGHHVTEFADGASAVAHVAGAAPGPMPKLMIVDYAMPAMNGGEVARAVWRDGAGPPILFVTGYAEADALEEWTARGYRMLAKPFTLHELATAIAAAIAARAGCGLTPSADGG